MNISLILAHPTPGSFNHAIARTAAETLRTAGHTVWFHDLCEEQFQPLLTTTEIQPRAKLQEDVAGHCREIAFADGIIIVHPNWWGMPPAILKGWIDRVLRQEVAYRFAANERGEVGPVGLLRARTAIVFNTANTPQQQEDEIFGDPLDNLWKNCVFNFCGVPTVHRRNFTSVIVSTPEQRAAWLAEVRETVATHFASAVSAQPVASLVGAT